MQAEKQQGKRKSARGIVISNKMDKTVVVQVQRTIRHHKYGKVVLRNKKLYAHNESKLLNVGDQVEVIETRPLSKLKRWRIVG